MLSVSFDDLFSHSNSFARLMPQRLDETHYWSQGVPKKADGVATVNTARGSLIDEHALVEALESGKALSAGLDVLEKERQIHVQVLNDEKGFILTHVSGLTYETQAGMELLVLASLKKSIIEGTLITPVLEQQSKENTSTSTD